jgi:hypothetical protein
VGGHKPAQPLKKPHERMRQFMERVRMAYRQLQRKAAAVVKEPFRQRGVTYGR